MFYPDRTQCTTCMSTRYQKMCTLNISSKWYTDNIVIIDWSFIRPYLMISLNLKWENFFQSGNFEETGKVGEFYPKYWKSEGFLASFYFYFFSDFLIKVYLLNRCLYIC